MATKSELTRARILDAAIVEFAVEGESSVSIVDVAARAEITSQAVYRYFGNKRELFLAAIVQDFNTLIFSVLQDCAQLPAPIIGGAIWEVLIKHIPQHPLAVNAVLSREPHVVDALNETESADLLRASLTYDIVHASELGFLRDDIDPHHIAASASYMIVNISLPLVFAGKYFSEEWFAIAGTILAAAFYPVPNFQEAQVQADFVGKIQAVGINVPLKNYKFD